MPRAYRAFLDYFTLVSRTVDYENPPQDISEGTAAADEPWVESTGTKPPPDLDIVDGGDGGYGAITGDMEEVTLEEENDPVVDAATIDDSAVENFDHATGWGKDTSEIASSWDSSKTEAADSETAIEDHSYPLLEQPNGH